MGVAMAGRAKAASGGARLRDDVAELGRKLGLDVSVEVKVGRRLWGARRSIDVVLRSPETRQSLGIECKFQGTAGSAEEKIPATIDDIRAWPIRGLVVFDGEGFAENMRTYLVSTGMAVEYVDLRPWLELDFGIQTER
jgi:hypothetical protein